MNFKLLLISPILSYLPLFFYNSGELSWYSLVFALCLIIIIENIVSYRLRVSPVKRGGLRQLLKWRMMFWITRMLFIMIDCLAGYLLDYEGFIIMFSGLLPILFILFMGFEILFKIAGENEDGKISVSKRLKGE